MSEEELIETFFKIIGGNRMKNNNITIEFTAIMDYLRDKDLEILELKNKNEKQSKIINKLKITLENENRNVYSLLKKKLLDILEVNND